MPRHPLAAFFLVLLAGFSAGETIEFRTFKTSRPISNAIKSNLDGGNLANDRFETTYDKLVLEKKIEELSRFIKNDAGNELIKFEVTAPANRWKTIIQAEPTFAEGFCQLALNTVLLPPSNRNPDEAPVIDSISTGSYDYGRWHVVEETNFGTDLIMNLVRFVKSSATVFPDHAMILAIESHLVPMKEVDAVNMARQPVEKLEGTVARTLSGNTSFDSFRIQAVSGQKQSVRKNADEHPGYQGIGKGPLAVRFDSEATVSPDAKWVHLRTYAGIDHVEASTQNQPAYTLTFTDTIRIGRWKAVSATKHPAGNSVVLFIRVSHLRADQWKPGKNDGPWKPAKADGRLKQYENIHPNFTFNIGVGISGQPRGIRETLIAHGVSGGSWEAFPVGSTIIVKDADENTHRMIEQVLANFTWDKVTAGK